jgi:hypothetical protein
MISKITNLIKNEMFIICSEFSAESMQGYDTSNIFKLDTDLSIGN